MGPCTHFYPVPWNGVDARTLQVLRLQGGRLGRLPLPGAGFGWSGQCGRPGVPQSPRPQRGRAGHCPTPTNATTIPLQTVWQRLRRGPTGALPHGPTGKERPATPILWHTQRQIAYSQHLWLRSTDNARTTPDSGTPHSQHLRSSRQHPHAPSNRAAEPW